MSRDPFEEEGYCEIKVRGIEMEFDHEKLAIVTAQQKEQGTVGVDPSCPTGKLPEAEFMKFQAEFERKRANRFHDDLEKAEGDNLETSALLTEPDQTQSLDFLT
ncbi:hypothetical protein Dimus_022622 [Dionaea muscipula]